MKKTEAQEFATYSLSKDHQYQVTIRPRKTHRKHKMGVRFTAFYLFLVANYGVKPIVGGGSLPNRFVSYRYAFGDDR